MYELENEDHIAIERNETNMEYTREGFGKHHNYLLSLIGLGSL